MRSHARALDDVVLVERTDETVVFFFREESSAGVARWAHRCDGVANLAPGLYRVRRFLMTDPAADLGELFLEIGTCAAESFP